MTGNKRDKNAGCASCRLRLSLAKKRVNRDFEPKTPVSSALAGCALSQPAVFFGISATAVLILQRLATRFCTLLHRAFGWTKWRVPRRLVGIRCTIKIVVRWQQIMPQGN
jgi:hypothetical protein